MLTRMTARFRRSEEGFTLIELLVVVAIIALLATFAVPKLFEAINKSKKAPAQADMKTISGALERYYMDNNEYPNGADLDAIKDQLHAGYLKASTSYTNGFGRGYIYVSDANGTFYVLIDAMNQDPTVPLTLTCNGVAVTGINTGAGDLSYEVVATIDATDVQAGCTISAGLSPGNTATVVTN